MAEWSSGYVVEVDYTHGFYQELTPGLLSLGSLLQSVRSPGLAAEPLAYCELGCGQGYSTNLLAAANPHIQFYATDFNPGHIAGAQALAQAARLRNVHFSDDSFAEYLQRNDLPDFDFVCLHGIYSWISPENRRTIVDFIARRLKPGGVVYISYNAMPGWASIMPLRRLMTEHVSSQGTSKSLLARIPATLDFASRLAGVDARYFANNPKVAPRLDGLKSKNRNYLAHEYLNEHSQPFYFTDLAQELAEAKLTWVGPAHAMEAIDAINLTPEQRQLLSEIDNVALRQMVRDHIVDQQFRRDIFIKGPVTVSRGVANEAWLETRFALTRKASDIPRQLQGARYKVNFQPEIYDPVIAALGQGPRALREMMNEPAVAKLGLGRTVQALTFLVAQGTCQPCLPGSGLAERKLQTDLFNRAVSEHSRYEQKFSHFASPVTGGGIAVDRITQLIWLARSNREHDAARFVWNAMSKAGQRLMKDGKPLKTEDENLAEIRRRIESFEADILPLWTDLGLGFDMSAADAPAKRQVRA